METVMSVKTGRTPRGERPDSHVLQRQTVHNFEFSQFPVSGRKKTPRKHVVQ